MLATINHLLSLGVRLISVSVNDYDNGDDD